MIADVLHPPTGGSKHKEGIVQLETKRESHALTSVHVGESHIYV